MTMACRDIANMHLFLEMKQMFPDLPEDTLRDYVFLYAKEYDKCVKLLQQESQSHFHQSQKFTDIYSSDDKSTHKKSDDVKTAIHQQSLASSSPITTDSSNRDNKMPNKVSALYEYQQNELPSGRSISHAGVTHYPYISNLHVPLKNDSHSAPVIANHEKPFVNIYKQNPSSHSSSSQPVSSQDYQNRMMFSTTKEHAIEPPMTPKSELSSFLSSIPNSKHSKRHAVELSITPSFPFQQQQINVINNSVCATASHSSKPGRHTTSLNFQLQPQSSDQSPIEISTIPTNIGDPCNFRDFGSHVQISVGSQGATFTALRLQRPQSVPNQPTKYSAPLSPEHISCSTASSQPRDSKVYMFPSNVQPSSESTERNTFTKYFQDPMHSYAKDFQCVRNADSEQRPMYSYQLSQEYIEAVKLRQEASFNLIQGELEKHKVICSQLSSEVNRMEQEINEQRVTKSSFSYAEELKALREEIRKIRIECNCLLLEVDRSSSTPIPLGVTDEDFYSNIFTGPNGAISSSSLQNVPNSNLNTKNATPANKKDDDDDDDEKNRWRCKKCTFANYHALKNCEMCELPKNSGSVEHNSHYCSTAYLTLVPTSNSPPRRPVGSVQISVTRRAPSTSKSVKLQLTHRRPR